MVSGIVAASLTAIALVYVLFRCSTRPSLSRIRGPKSPSFALGNLLELFQRPVGQADFEWQSLYGNIIRFKTVFGGDQLLVADPKALQWIFNASAYRYPKQPNLRVISRMINGRGVVWADGDDHKRQRKVLLPGFGGPESKAFLSVFKGCAESMCTKWAEIIESSADQRAVFNVTAWLSRGTLDAIGQAAFDVQFGTFRNDEHPLVRKYANLLSDIFGRPSTQQIFIQAASKYFPPWILEWMTDHGSNSRLERAREVKKMVTEVGKKMVQERAETLLEGKGNRDVFSLLVKANMDTEAKNKLTEEELLAQMCTILLAGHETTSNSLSWILLELARHPKMQSRLRTEIRETEAAIRARGDTQFTMADFDAMPFTSAVIKEGLRYHPVVPHVHRIAGRDDVLPLSQPITTESGEVTNEIFVPKGTRIVASIAAYNRNTELWGDDAHEFNPDRWLDGVASGKKPVSIGVYSNLMTFIGGVRACLGWRFAVIEIQAFLVEIIGKFELTMTDRSERVCRAPSLVMVPMVDGELELGSQLPLAVSVAS
ncbi:cytochrome P450 [Boletus edulis]|uniref:Cytochrome P450 n=1 Tax=Boletus edulis BED1 TaxID=1328754 RepID=A0AAD4GBD2_BOLED|nr:cytochrome P450 [Boletus edulis]KAF8435085.1 cytochrome P450 [Boletus edulis BED1]